MYSSEDLEIKCKSNTIKLASFVEMQCKDTRKQIVEVKVDGRPSDSEKEPFVQSDTIQPASPSLVRIMIELRMSNGLHLSQRNLNYQDLVRLVEKLEGLC